MSNRDTWVIDNHDTFAVGELDHYSLTRLYYFVWFPNPTASEVDSCKLFGVRRVYTCSSGSTSVPYVAFAFWQADEAEPGIVELYDL